MASRAETSGEMLGGTACCLSVETLAFASSRSATLSFVSTGGARPDCYRLKFGCGGRRCLHRFSGLPLSAVASNAELDGGHCYLSCPGTRESRANYSKCL